MAMLRTEALTPNALVSCDPGGRNLRPTTACASAQTQVMLTFLGRHPTEGFATLVKEAPDSSFTSAAVSSRAGDFGVRRFVAWAPTQGTSVIQPLDGCPRHLELRHRSRRRTGAPIFHRSRLSAASDTSPARWPAGFRLGQPRRARSTVKRGEHPSDTPPASARMWAQTSTVPSASFELAEVRFGRCLRRRCPS